MWVLWTTSEFEGLARGTLGDCYRQDPAKGRAIVKETADGFSVSPLEAAIFFNIRAFVAEPASSDYLVSVWKGQVSCILTHSAPQVRSYINDFAKATVYLFQYTRQHY